MILPRQVLSEDSVYNHKLQEVDEAVEIAEWNKVATNPHVAGTIPDDHMLLVCAKVVETKVPFTERLIELIRNMLASV